MAQRHCNVSKKRDRYDSTHVDVVKSLQMTRIRLLPAKDEPKPNLSECLSVKSKDIYPSRGTAKVTQKDETISQPFVESPQSNTSTSSENNVSVSNTNNTQAGVTVTTASSQPSKGGERPCPIVSINSKERYQRLTLRPTKGELKLKAGIGSKSLNTDEHSDTTCRVNSLRIAPKANTSTFTNAESIGHRMMPSRRRTPNGNYRTAMSYNNSNNLTPPLIPRTHHFTAKITNSEGRVKTKIDIRSDNPSKRGEKPFSGKTRVITVGLPDDQRNSNFCMRSKTAFGYHSVSHEDKFKRATKSARLLRHSADPDGKDLDAAVSHAGCAALATRLETYVTQNNFQKFQATVCSWDLETKLRVVNFKHDSESSSTVFFLACQLSRIQLVELMLKECSPDLEQTGPFIVPEDDSIMYQVTPLWYAAATGNFQLVRLLTSYGANVNAASATKCTVMRAACCLSQVQIVAFLIAHGADIHIKNKNGATCLMNAISSTELTKLLVHHGAKINERDSLGNTALHYATEAGAMETVVLLNEMGGNPMITNNENCSVIQTAAKHRHKGILEYLLTVTTPRVDEIIDAYLLLGAMTIIIDSDYPSGVDYWHKAMNLRRINRSMKLSTHSKVSLLTEFSTVKDLTTVEDLNKISNDNGLLCLQALMTYERIRGPLNENYINLLMYRGAKCADERNLTLAVNLWRTSYKLQLQKHVDVDEKNTHFDIFNRNILRNLQFLVKVLHLVGQIAVEENNDQEFNEETCIVSEENVRDLFGLVCHHTAIASKILSRTLKENSQIVDNAFHFLLKSCLCLFGIYLQIFPPAKRNPDFGRLLQKLIILNPRGENNTTLLHMCVNPQTLESLGLDANGPGIQLWPYHAMMDILLLLGANSLARDAHGNTILHAAAYFHNQGFKTNPVFFRMLLRRGAHPDQVNHKGEMPLDILSQGDELRYLLCTTSLKCLAARQITVHNIPYIGEVPNCLYAFIELHGN